MTSITIQVTDEESARIDEVAQATGLKREDFLKAGVRDLLGGPDDDFKSLAKRIVEKNKDLYKRLA